jgi:hypothetical protein
MSELFGQQVIAVIWDFDKTLTYGYMQEPLFRRFGVDGNRFWSEVNGLAPFYLKQGLTRVSTDTLYLDHILQYVRNGTFAGLANADLRALGALIEFCPGVPEIFGHLRNIVIGDANYARHNISVEHYVVSTGLAQMIKGSLIAHEIEEIWACEFVEQIGAPGYLESAAENQLVLMELPKGNPVVGPIQGIGYHIDNTTKTRAIFEINKGVNKDASISVNDSIPEDERRVPFRQMIYIADGPSDVPVFSVLNKNGGRTYAVYDPASDASYRQAKSLNDQGRVNAFGSADYRLASETGRWLTTSVREIADEIASRRESQLAKTVGKPPNHLV